MTFEPLAIDGCFKITLKPNGDHRGYFVRTYDIALFAAHGLQTDWLQENQSFSATKGTVRGLHFQHGAAAETKLVRVLKGSLLDVAVDVRKGSPTFGKHVAVRLSEDNFTCLYIPRGCAHGFCTLEENTVIAYKVDNVYTPSEEGGLLWSDPALAIPWPDVENVVISDKDKLWPTLPEMRQVELPNPSSL